MSRTAAAGQLQRLGTTIFEILSRPELLSYIPYLTLQFRHHQAQCCRCIVLGHKLHRTSTKPQALRSNSQLCEHARA